MRACLPWHMASESAAVARRRREELSDFLRTRRARLTPVDVVGMAVAEPAPDAGPLRREEVADLAGVGVSWYTWLEQGRDINRLDRRAGRDRPGPAPERVRTRARLRAGRSQPPRTSAARDAEVTPELRRLLDTWTPPAMLRDRYWNMIAANEAAQQVFRYGDTDHNCLIAFFTNARYRAMPVEWESAAPGVVAAYRADAAHASDDPGFARVVADLERGQPRVRRPVAPPRRGPAGPGGQGDPPPRGGRPVLRHDHPGGGRPPVLVPGALQPAVRVVVPLPCSTRTVGFRPPSPRWSP